MRDAVEAPGPRYQRTTSFSCIFGKQAVSPPPAKPSNAVKYDHRFAPNRFYQWRLASSLQSTKSAVFTSASFQLCFSRCRTLPNPTRPREESSSSPSLALAGSTYWSTRAQRFFQYRALCFERHVRLIPPQPKAIALELVSCTCTLERSTSVQRLFFLVHLVTQLRLRGRGRSYLSLLCTDRSPPSSPLPGPAALRVQAMRQRKLSEVEGLSLPHGAPFGKRSGQTVPADSSREIA